MADQSEGVLAKHELESRHAEGGPFVQAVDATSMAMIVTDCRAPTNPIIFANDAFLELTGYSRDEVLGKNYRLLYGENTDPETEGKVALALAATGDISLETLMYRKDGHGLWVMHHVAVQRENGEVRRHFASFFDIDRRVRAEHEVRRAHDLLELRVERRTRELTRTVDELRRENQKRIALEDVLRHALDDKEHLLHQREFLVREVNHRVKNTLQMASAFLTVQAGTTSERAVAEGLRAAITRLDRLSDVHRLLYESADVTLGVDLDTYLGDLCHHLMVANEGDSQRITLKVSVEEGLWSADEAISIALIVNEAVTNSLKHAFPNSRIGVIEVSLRCVGEDFYELGVADNGVGCQALGRPGSLGMKLIETFARQLRGNLAITHNRGLKIAISFPHADVEMPRSAE